MKRSVWCGLLIVVLILSITNISTNVDERKTVSQEIESVDITESVLTIPQSQERDYFFTTIADTPFAPARLSNISNLRVPATVVKTENNAYNSVLRGWFSSLTHRQLHTIKLIYVSLYSQKQEEGYYIYTLRKLLI